MTTSRTTTPLQFITRYILYRYTLCRPQRRCRLARNVIVSAVGQASTKRPNIQLDTVASSDTRRTRWKTIRLPADYTHARVNTAYICKQHRHWHRHREMKREREKEKERYRDSGTPIVPVHPLTRFYRKIYSFERHSSRNRVLPSQYNPWCVLPPLVNAKRRGACYSFQMCSIGNWSLVWCVFRATLWI